MMEPANAGNRPKISMIIPAYNEEKYLGAAIENVNQAIKEYQKTYSYGVELIVVNNNSTDRTEQVAREYGAEVVFEGKNQEIRGDEVIRPRVDMAGIPALPMEVEEQEGVWFLV